MLTRLVILLAVVGQLAISGLCAAFCGPMVAGSVSSDGCCVAPEPMAPETGCCPAETSVPPGCPTEHGPLSNCDPAPLTDPCPTCPIPCCSALPPNLPVLVTPSFTLVPTPAFEFLPCPWSVDSIADAPIRHIDACEPAGPPGLHERLASLCVWVI